MPRGVNETLSKFTELPSGETRIYHVWTMKGIY